MAQRAGNILLIEFASTLLVRDENRYLEKIVGVENHYLTPIDVLQTDVLLPVQCTDIFNYLGLAKSFGTSQRLASTIKTENGRRFTFPA